MLFRDLKNYIFYIEKLELLYKNYYGVERSNEDKVIQRLSKFYIRRLFKKIYNYLKLLAENKEEHYFNLKKKKIDVPHFIKKSKRTIKRFLDQNKQSSVNINLKNKLLESNEKYKCNFTNIKSLCIERDLTYNYLFFICDLRNYFYEYLFIRNAKICKKFRIRKENNFLYLNEDTLEKCYNLKHESIFCKGCNQEIRVKMISYHVKGKKHCKNKITDIDYHFIYFIGDIEKLRKDIRKINKIINSKGFQKYKNEDLNIIKELGDKEEEKNDLEVFKDSDGNVYDKNTYMELLKNNLI